MVPYTLAANSPDKTANPLIQAEMLVDLESGSTVISSHSETAINPGGLTKLITLYTAMSLAEEKNKNLSAIITIKSSPSTKGTNSKRLLLKRGDKVPFSFLCQAVMLMGAEDAIKVIIDWLDLTEVEFVEQMNRISSSIGLKNSYFTSPFETINPSHHTTLMDMGTITTKLLTDFPVVKIWGVMRDLSYRGVKHINTNSLLWRSNAITGVMTDGEIGKNNWNAVILSENQRPNGTVRRLLAITMNNKTQSDMTSRVMSILKTGYQQFETLKIYQRGETVAKFKVFKGIEKEVEAVTDTDVYVTVTRDLLFKKGAQSFKTEVTRINPLIAPLKQNTNIGFITVYFNGEVVASTSISTKSTILEGSLWHQLYDTIQLALLDNTNKINYFLNKTQN